MTMPSRRAGPTRIPAGPSRCLFCGLVGPLQREGTPRDAVPFVICSRCQMPSVLLCPTDAAYTQMEKISSVGFLWGVFEYYVLFAGFGVCRVEVFDDDQPRDAAIAEFVTAEGSCESSVAAGVVKSAAHPGAVDE